MAAVSIFLILALADMRAAEGDRWAHVGGSGDAEIYIDRSIGIDGDKRIVWQKSVYPELGPQGEAIVRTEYDCIRRTFSPTAYIFRDRSGSVINQRTVSAGARTISAVSSDPRAENVLEIVCGLG